MLSGSAFFTAVLLGLPPLALSNLCCSVGRITVDDKDLVDHTRRDITEEQADGLRFIITRSDYRDTHSSDWKLRPAPHKRDVDGRVLTRRSEGQRCGYDHGNQQLPYPANSQFREP